MTLALGGRPILTGVSLAIESGEFVGVLGPNGAGKTTLMRAILGLVRPAGGIDPRAGRAGARAAIRAVGYMPQTRRSRRQPAPQRLGFRRQRRRRSSLGPAGASAAERREVACGARPGRRRPTLAKRPLAETSGGERQRLLLAQALLGRPRLLLLDEPLISLDPHHQRARGRAGARAAAASSASPCCSAPTS